GYHATPELGLAAHVNIVLTGKCELAIVADSEDGEAGAQRLDGSALAHRKWLDARCDHHAGGRINREGAQLDAVPVDVLDQRWLAGPLVNREHRDAVLAAREHSLAFELDGGRRAVRLIDEPSVRVHVNGARTLAERRFRVEERFLDEHRVP